MLESSGAFDLQQFLKDCLPKGARFAPDPKCPYCRDGWIFFAVDRNGNLVNLSRCSGRDSSTGERISPVVCDCELAKKLGLYSVIRPKKGVPYKNPTWWDLVLGTGFQRIEYFEAFQRYARAKIEELKSRPTTWKPQHERRAPAKETSHNSCIPTQDTRSAEIPQSGGSQLAEEEIPDE